VRGPRECIIVGTWLIITIVLSSVGAGYFIYGWRQKEGNFLAAGIALTRISHSRSADRSEGLFFRGVRMAAEVIGR
jgi:hypothetical protein